MHRIGRTGRAGKTGRATAFYVPGHDPKVGNDGLAKDLRKIFEENDNELPSCFGGGNSLGGKGKSSKGKGGGNEKGASTSTKGGGKSGSQADKGSKKGDGKRGSRNQDQESKSSVTSSEAMPATNKSGGGKGKSGGKGNGKSKNGGG